MKPKKVMRERDEHGPRHVTPAGHSVFHDLFPKAEADELVMRSTLLRGLEHWLKASGLTQIQAAKALGVTQARVSDLNRGKINRFSLDLLAFGRARRGSNVSSTESRSPRLEHGEGCVNSRPFPCVPPNRSS